MSSWNQNRFVLVTRKTRYQELVERFNTWAQAEFYLEHNQVDSKDYLLEHDLYLSCLREAEDVLKRKRRFQLLERSFLPNYLFAPTDIVVVIGQDGLVANTLKYLSGQQVIAVNPDPKRWDGLLLPFHIGELEAVVARVENNRASCKEITFAQARTNDGQKILAVNDLFIGPKSHISARYRLSWDGRSEVQSSSGIIVSTGFGSTGWLKSVLAGARGVMGSGLHPLTQGFEWRDEKLIFSVREPFPSSTTGTDMVFGEVTCDKSLRVESLMPENGVIFSDGLEQDYLPFNAGAIVTIDLAPAKGVLVVNHG